MGESAEPAVRITVLTSTDAADCAAAHAVIDASRRHGRPWHESGSVAELTRSLQHRPPGDRLLVWLARRGADAPSGEIDWEPETLTPAKLAAAEMADERIGRTRVTSLAVHEATGRVVAFTEIVAPGTTPRSVRQEGTLVHGEHRGHRLGLAVKVANIRALAQVAPTRELVITGNADTNPWMIAINEQLGFRPAEAALTCHRRLPDRGE